MRKLRKVSAAWLKNAKQTRFGKPSAYGLVYRASHPKFGDLIIKWMTPSDALYESFMHEYVWQNIPESAKHHFCEPFVIKGVVTPHIGLEDGHLVSRIPFVQARAMNAIALQDLLQSCKVTAKLDRISESIASALFAMHQLGVTHGDFHTNNVMIRGTDAIIIDIGLAKFLNKLPTTSDTRLSKKMLYKGVGAHNNAAFVGIKPGWNPGSTRSFIYLPNGDIITKTAKPGDVGDMWHDHMHMTYGSMLGVAAKYKKLAARYQKPKPREYTTQFTMPAIQENSSSTTSPVKAISPRVAAARIQRAYQRWKKQKGAAKFEQASPVSIPAPAPKLGETGFHFVQRVSHRILAGLTIAFSACSSKYSEWMRAIRIAHKRDQLRPRPSRGKERVTTRRQKSRAPVQPAITKARRGIRHLRRDMSNMSWEKLPMSGPVPMSIS